ncbi:MAG: Energy-dependent translational throttle protein EttA [uncultured Phycisphaerae bacterium]|uniref:Energy-dependent translational throttle protein EttA n=1 Tax=uncultured Phycisphaerae bacterium TaxID=904963 RepID=A0A6J4QA67_9BACT|nr:MAG: Energy-dependent translational throttle protein EttA [uncultured Phycisphaerae bacterium]
MAIASLSKVEKHFGKKVLFENLDLSIYEGERVGFIGDNGSGKSTLFKMLTGQLKPDAGTVSVGRNTKVGYLVQNPEFEPTNTVIDEAELGMGKLHDLAHAMRDLEHRMAEAGGDELDRVLERYQNVQHEFDLAGGYAWQHKMEATLLGVGLGRETWEQTVSVLSGGQRSRLALTKLLLSEPDLLLLDEPTNHLDLAAIEWLEGYLADFAGAVVLISHDRYLLDRLATRIVWLNRAQIDSYPGSYSAYVEQRELNELTQQRAYELQQKDIAKQEEFIRRFKAGQRSKEAKGREKRLERLKEGEDLVRRVGTQQKINLSLNSNQRAGDRVLQVRELSKSFGDRTLWEDVSLEIARGERVGIIGPNGSGKTTLLKALMSQEPVNGGVVKWGANLSVAYYDQRLDMLNPSHTLTDAIQVGRNVSDKSAREVLALMLFRNDDLPKTIDLLSGGEKARVRLAQLLIDRPNVLVLDEPTNHLDIASREALEAALGEFEGTILCVSHDRYFLDQSVERLWVLTPPGVTDFGGNYSAWVEKQRSDEKRAKETAASGSKGRKG